MRKTMQVKLALALAFCLTGAVGFAQGDGAAIYKAKCLNCHGATGMADTNVGKALKVRPVSDPGVKKLTLAAQIASTKNGEGKMPSFKDKLTDAQIKESVEYFRTLIH